MTLKESIGRTHNTQCTHVEETQNYLGKIGVTLDDLDKLSVIHVAGTKGKVEILFVFDIGELKKIC